MGIDARIHYKLISIAIMLLGVVPELLAELVNIAGVDVAAEQKIAKIIDDVREPVMLGVDTRQIGEVVLVPLEHPRTQGWLCFGPIHGALTVAT
jgi:hypothetical protein